MPGVACPPCARPALNMERRAAAGLGLGLGLGGVPARPMGPCRLGGCGPAVGTVAEAGAEADADAGGGVKDG